jgi:uncharacterized membrane protein YgcG
MGPRVKPSARKPGGRFGRARLIDVGVLVLVAGFLAHGTASAADAGWIITDFTSDLTVQSDGVVAVTETIKVDFQGLAKHGIYRDMPYAYREADGTTSYTAVEVRDVLQDDAPAIYAVERNESNVRIRIGDPNRTIAGAHTYVIHYTVTGALRAFADYDELYWNITGDQWDAPIRASAATVRLSAAGVKQVSCYAGPRGSTASCSTSGYDDTTAHVAETAELPPGAGLTVAVGFTKGMVPVLTADRVLATGEDPRGMQTAVGVAVLTLIAGVWLILRRWWRLGRDRWFGDAAVHAPDASAEPLPLGAHETIVAEYDPPEDLRPAELGVVKDETADTLDVSATVVDLAVRGYLEITEVPKSSWLGKTDYELKRRKPADDALRAYEKELLDGLFDPQYAASARSLASALRMLSGRTEPERSPDVVRVSELKDKFYACLKEVKELLYQDVVEKGFFSKNPSKVRANNAVLAFAMIGIGWWGSATFIGQIPLFSSMLHAALAGFFIALIPLGIVYLVVALRAMPQRTAKGRELYRKIRGYEIYLKSVEQYRQQFFEREGTFMQVLPYVIMFGLTERLAKAMAAMGMQPPSPAWYHGNYAAFNIAAFSSSLSSFSSALSSNMASAPGGSGSGGGGFSGGGGGGGGGGSW